LMAASLVGGIRLLLAQTNPGIYTKADALTSMALLRDRGPAEVYRGPDAAPPMPAVTTSVLDRVRARGLLRVGYFKDSLPYAFVNARGELVGLDIEMAHQLALDLQVGLELVLLDRSVLDGAVDPALCDVIMSGAAITADRAGRLQYSTSYLDETVAFIVPDHLASEFSDWSTVKAMGPIRIAMPKAPYYVQKVRDELGEAVIVPVDGMDEMFSAQAPHVDAFIATAERGSAYTLLHPEYSVAVPKPRPFKVPLAYVVAGRDAAMASMVDTWIELKRKDGTIDALFAHWILGADSAARGPRWSVLRDVLHWVQ
jgi:ABC-type amino acid transport substrate-binding protein